MMRCKPSSVSPYVLLFTAAYTWVPSNNSTKHTTHWVCNWTCTWGWLPNVYDQTPCQQVGFCQGIRSFMLPGPPGELRASQARRPCGPSYVMAYGNSAQQPTRPLSRHAILVRFHEKVYPASRCGQDKPPLGGRCPVTAFVPPACRVPPRGTSAAATSNNSAHPSARFRLASL
jgi:hypothetical protein